jgi:hypothetical protein
MKVFGPFWVDFLDRIRDRDLVSIFYVYISFSNICFVTFVKNHMATAMWTYFWIFYSIDVCVWFSAIAMSFLWL